MQRATALCLAFPEWVFLVVRGDGIHQVTAKLDQATGTLQPFKKHFPLRGRSSGYGQPDQSDEAQLEMIKSLQVVKCINNAWVQLCSALHFFVGVMRSVLHKIAFRLVNIGYNDANSI